VKFLLDENQSPVLVDLIVAAGHDVVHARDIGLKSAPDSMVLETAAETGRVLISGDTDFGELKCTIVDTCRFAAAVACEMSAR
jgi:predicted nuclease of predicted toxin-antitoxin system